MTTFTLPDLRRILETSSGAVEGVDWAAPETADALFGELGYDSLAMLELASIVRQEYGVVIPDDAATSMKTPRDVLDFVNARLAEA
ncbi:acyl carrier protein [Catenuloplanes atrovinosus]|uniref:Act minimal PKS acyl carrier protein n=1 Tax=Catenuloplanes atrovinosus TaxID=137266 RepID=A0AAE3YN01_9ACTN|nr:acyl carrier protein [Catenuloplanes atrovinosus]MDR7276788.1 act minimal PKS acyl carrier protein [Catenuloplanes atrovinosus]